MSIDIEFQPIWVSTLRGDLQIPFDVYVKVAGKYIHYCRRGTSFEGARLERLRTKKLRRMFIRASDHLLYQQYLDASIEAAYSNTPPRPMAIRAEVIQGFEQALAETCMDDPSDEIAYKQARSSVHRFVDFLEREPEGIGALLSIPNTDASVSHHGMNVATLATAMVLKTGVPDGQPLHLLTLGCLLHDIEHIYTEQDMSRPLSAMTVAEQAIYKQHCLNGAKRFQVATLFMDQLVLNIIAQHEEHMDGSGYPKRLNEVDMDPLVMVAAAANAYDRQVSFEGKTAKDALKHLLIDKMGAYPLAQMQALQDILKTRGLI